MSRHPTARRSDPGNLTGALLRNTPLFRAWIRFTTDLRAVGTIAARDRELLVLRTAWLCRAEYEWGQHVASARSIGMTAEETERVTIGSSNQGWTAEERSLLQAAEELHEHATITDPTWADLAAWLTDEQLIEVPFVVGWYHLMAFALNGLRIPLERGRDGLDSR